MVEYQNFGKFGRNLGPVDWRRHQICLFDLVVQRGRLEDGLWPPQLCSGGRLAPVARLVAELVGQAFGAARGGAASIRAVLSGAVDLLVWIPKVEGEAGGPAAETAPAPHLPQAPLWGRACIYLYGAVDNKGVILADAG